MFRGINALNVDVKGRFAMPTRYRDLLIGQAHGQLVLTIDTDEHCLLLYPLKVWEEIEKKVAALPSFNPQARRIQRLLIGHATEIEMDAQGRLLLPPLLRDYAKVGKRLVLIGQGSKFELWDDKAWNQRRDVWLTEEVSGELSTDLQSLSL